MRNKDLSNNRLLDDADELFKLSRQDPSTLTPAQREAVEGAFSRLRNTVSEEPTHSNIIELVSSSISSLGNDKIGNVEPAASRKEQERQTVLMERLVKLQEPLSDDVSKPIGPHYDRKKRILTFANMPIRLVKDSDAEIICKKLFRNSKPVKRPVEIGDIAELLGIDRKDKKTFYNKVRSLNRIVEKATGVEKLFDYIDKKLWFNIKYVKLPL